MEKESKIILKEELEVLSKQAYQSAKNKGFYPKDVNTAFLLMFIIVEMSEVLQADRKGRHGSIEDYETDIAIRILSLLGWIMEGDKIELSEDEDLIGEYKLASYIFGFDLVGDLYRIIEKMGVLDLDSSPSWYLAKYLQELLMDIFAIAHNNNIDLKEQIKLKMKYNETRPYLHEYKY